VKVTLSPNEPFDDGDFAWPSERFFAAKAKRRHPL
jgi:hypothetical protein